MTCSVSRLKAQRGKPKAKHIESELLSAVARTAPPAGCRSPVGERGSNTDFLDALPPRGIWETKPRNTNEAVREAV